MVLPSLRWRGFGFLRRSRSISMLPSTASPGLKGQPWRGVRQWLHDLRRWLAAAATIALLLALLLLKHAWQCQAPEGRCAQPVLQEVEKALPAWFNASCPLVYDRIPYEKMQRRKAKPYLLGQQQQPSCINCRKDELWSHFCQFKSHGPVCPQWDQDHLFETLMGRASEGADGARELLALTPCDLFPYMRGRTLWLVGDSMMQEFMRALQCFMFEFWDLQTRQMEDLVADKASTMEGLLGGWCVLMPEDSRICHIRSNMGDWLVTDLAPKFGALGVRRQDIMVLNFAVWVNVADEYAGNLDMWADYYERHKAALPFVLWRDASVQHFDTPTGDFKCDGCPDAQPLPDNKGFHCKPIERVSLDARNALHTTDPAMQIIVEGGWRNRISDPVMARLGIPVMRTWNLSVPLWEYHHGFQEKDDCTHWCHPSGYQVWVAQLHASLKQELHNLPPPTSLLLPQRTQSLHAAGSATRAKHRLQAND